MLINNETQPSLGRGHPQHTAFNCDSMLDLDKQSVMGSGSIRHNSQTAFDINHAEGIRHHVIPTPTKSGGGNLHSRPASKLQEIESLVEKANGLNDA